MSEQMILFQQSGVELATPRRDLVAQERAALVTARLFTRGSLTLSEARELTGLTYCGVWYLMSKVARVTAIWYERETQTWRKND